MRRSQFAAAVSVLLVIATASWVLIANPGQRRAAADGRLVVKRLIELGIAQTDEVRRVPIEIINPSSNPALLGEFRASCACMQLYEMVGQDKRQLAKLRIEPQSSSTIYTDLYISGQSGSRQATTVAFRDLGSEAAYYQVAIAFTPTCHVFTVPQSINFGEIPVDTAATRRLELRSNGSFRGQIEALTHSNSDVFTLAFVDPGNQFRKEFSQSMGGQELIGFVDIVLKPQTEVANISEEIVLLNGDEKVCRIPVSATVMADIALTPSTLVLPRFASGEMSYSARLICRSRSHSPFTIEFVEAGESFRVDVARPQDDGPGSPAVITLNYDGPKPADEARHEKLEFKVKSSQGEQRFIMPVTVLPLVH